MLSFFTSSDWAIIATQLLAGFITTSAVMGFMLWRHGKAHINRAKQLLADQNAIIEAAGEMFEQQIRKKRPDVDFDEQTRKQYAERSADVIKAMIAPWLEPKKSDLTPIARTMLKTRQQDLIELLDLLSEPPEPENQIDPEKFEQLKKKAKSLVGQVKQLEKELATANEQHDRTQEHLNAALDTVNTMVREYGRHLKLDDKPKVDELLRAIIMTQAMDQGDDCETARAKAEAATSEEIEAVTEPSASKATAGAAAAGGAAASEAIYGDESELEDGAAETEQTSTDAASEKEPISEQPGEPDNKDIDDLLDQAQTDDKSGKESAESQQEDKADQPSIEDIDALLDDAQDDGAETKPQPEPVEKTDEPETADPKHTTEDDNAGEFDDIDALLDEEQNREKADDEDTATQTETANTAASDDTPDTAEKSGNEKQPEAAQSSDTDTVTEEPVSEDPELDEIDALLADEGHFSATDGKTNQPESSTSDQPQEPSVVQELDDIDALFKTADADDDEPEPTEADQTQKRDERNTPADTTSEQDDIDALLADIQESETQPEDRAEKTDADNQKNNENKEEDYKADDEEEDIVDLDEVEIPKNQSSADMDDLDLDDIDKLLDDEINKHHAKHTEESRNQNR